MLSEKADGKMAKAGLLRTRKGDRTAATRMQRMRQRRKDGGLVEFRAMVTPEERRRLRAYLEGLRQSTSTPAT